PFDHPVSVPASHLVEEANLVEGAKPYLGPRGLLPRHLERTGELDLADANTGLGYPAPRRGRVLELDRLMASVEAEAEMTVDDLRIHSPPAHGWAEAIVEEGDRLVARRHDAVGLGLETDPDPAAVPVGEPMEIHRQVGKCRCAFFRTRCPGGRRIGQRQSRDRPLLNVRREKLAQDVRE